MCHILAYFTWVRNDLLGKTATSILHSVVAALDDDDDGPLPLFTLTPLKKCEMCS